jgi:hypothetical protein
MTFLLARVAARPIEEKLASPLTMVPITPSQVWLGNSTPHEFCGAFTNWDLKQENQVSKYGLHI